MLKSNSLKEITKCYVIKKTEETAHLLDKVLLKSLSTVLTVNATWLALQDITFFLLLPSKQLIAYLPYNLLKPDLTLKRAFKYSSAYYRGSGAFRLSTRFYITGPDLSIYSNRKHPKYTLSLQKAERPDLNLGEVIFTKKACYMHIKEGYPSTFFSRILHTKVPEMQCSVNSVTNPLLMHHPVKYKINKAFSKPESLGPLKHYLCLYDIKYKQWTK